jgi:mannose-binding lectin 1
MSALKIVQSPSNFQVLIDGRLCFESSKIRLPLGYNPGITAVSGESPDSFEIGRFVVTTRSHDHDPPSPSADITSENLLNIGQKAADEAGESAHGPPPPVIDIADPNDPPEVPAEKVDSKMQFADLHDRVQALMRHIQAFQRDYVTNNLDMLQRLKAIHHMVSKSQYSSRPDNTPGGTPSSGGPPGGGKWGQEALAKTLDEALAKMERRLEGLEGKVAEMANTLSHVKYAVSDSVGAGHIEDLKRTVREHHSDLLAAGPKGHGFLIFMIVGCQAGIVAAYVLYDRRRGRGEKKYL